jgi:transcriptional regulator GlxA family with amidase domain
MGFLQAWAGPDAGSGLQLCMSVCTGAALLAAAGLLDGRRCVCWLLDLNSLASRLLTGY